MLRTVTIFYMCNTIYNSVLLLQSSTIEGRYDDSWKTVGSKLIMYHSRTKQIYK